MLGKPLIAHTIETALRTAKLNRIVVSTDDPAIAETAVRWGAEAPFLRPADLATDAAPMVPVMRHAVAYLEEQGDSYDVICLLQPTSFRLPEDIDACVELMETAGADTVISVLPVPHKHNPHWVFEPDANGGLRLSTKEAQPVPRRQDLPPAYHRDGAVYLVRRDVLMQQNTLYGPKIVGYEMDPERSVNIDDPSDWDAAVSVLARVVAA
jgi:CMP-N-acetylneuraminic acid synthetase